MTASTLHSVLVEVEHPRQHGDSRHSYRSQLRDLVVLLCVSTNVFAAGRLCEASLPLMEAETAPSLASALTDEQETSGLESRTMVNAIERTVGVPESDPRALGNAEAGLSSSTS